ncbi:MAG: P-type conjugative transfer protein TrbL [Acidithiobacillus sp.]
MRKKIAGLYAGFLLFLVPAISFADTSTGLGSVRSELESTIMPWQGVMQTAATDLFYVLAAVEFSVLFLNHVLNKRGHEDFFASVIKKVVTLGFFLTVLDNAGTWFPAIINGLAGGAHALGVTTVTPGTIAGEALKTFLGVAFAPVAAAAHNDASFWSDLISFNFSGMFSSLTKLLTGANPFSLLLEMLMSVVIGLLAGLGILVMALEFLMVQIESYLVIALGVIMLAGGGLRWTAKYVGTYFDYAVNVGVRLFILTALAYLVTYSITPLIEKTMQNVANPFQMAFQVLILGAVVALLPRKASSIANSLLSGKSSFTGGEMMKEGAMVAGGTVMAGAGLAAAGVGLAGAAGAGSLGAAAGAGGGSAGGAAGGAGSLSAAASGAGEAAAGVPVPAGVMESLPSAGGSGPAGGASGGAPASSGSSSGSAGAPSGGASQQSGTQPKKDERQSEDPASSVGNNAPSAPAQGEGPAAGREQSSGAETTAAEVAGGAALATGAAADMAATTKAAQPASAPATAGARTAAPAPSSAGGGSGSTPGQPAGQSASGGAAPVSDGASGEAPATPEAPLPPVSDAHGVPAPSGATLDDVVNAIKQGQPKPLSLKDMAAKELMSRGKNHVIDDTLFRKDDGVSGSGGIQTGHGQD